MFSPMEAYVIYIIFGFLPHIMFFFFLGAVVSCYFLLPYKESKSRIVNKNMESINHVLLEQMRMLDLFNNDLDKKLIEKIIGLNAYMKYMDMEVLDENLRRKYQSYGEEIELLDLESKEFNQIIDNLEMDRSIELFGEFVVRSNKVRELDSLYQSFNEDYDYSVVDNLDEIRNVNDLGLEDFESRFEDQLLFIPDHPDFVSNLESNLGIIGEDSFIISDQRQLWDIEEDDMDNFYEPLRLDYEELYHPVLSLVDDDEFEEMYDILFEVLFTKKDLNNLLVVARQRLSNWELFNEDILQEAFDTYVNIYHKDPQAKLGTVTVVDIKDLREVLTNVFNLYSESLTTLEEISRFTKHLRNGLALTEKSLSSVLLANRLLKLRIIELERQRL